MQPKHTTDASGSVRAVGEDVRWWRSAVVYQIYPRSFFDDDGDGDGDLRGVRRRLDHLVTLGVDALWLSPFYRSPQADGGYDVADYRDVDPMYGTLDDAAQLIREAHERELRVIVDLVPNHTSAEHAWFQAALAAAPGAPERARYLFRDGRGPDGSQPPSNWVSNFGGPAWTRVPDGQWYLHLFAPEQPDLNWADPEVVAEFEDVLRFWLDLGVDGFRVDVAHGLAKDPALPDLEPLDAPAGAAHPYWDRDEVHEIYRGWRRVADRYPGERIFVAEAWVDTPERLARYLRPDELHTAFSFDLLQAAWDAGALRAAIERNLDALRGIGAPATWVLANHDVPRTVTRYGREDSSFSFEDRRAAIASDVERGTRRARAAALLTLALPGSLYLYQGEELGLPDAEDIPDARRRDPAFWNSGGADLGRDGCRAPLPWTGEHPPYGFNAGAAAGAAEPWLPQPPDWAELTAAAQSGRSDSMLRLYRHGLALRRTLPELRTTELRWLAAPTDVLALCRGDDFGCLVNLGSDPIALPEGATVLLSSDELVDGQLRRDTAAWVNTAAAGAAT